PASAPSSTARSAAPTDPPAQPYAEGGAPMTPPTLADRRPTLTTVNTVQLLVSLDLCIVNVALPDIAAGLGFSANGLAWVVHAYVLTFGGLLLLGGRLADVLGRRRMLITGLAVFAFASLLGGLAATPGQLVAARALQGVGAAVTQPASLAVLTLTFPAGPARARAFGIWSASNALGAALGVVPGGVLTGLGARRGPDRARRVALGDAADRPRRRRAATPRAAGAAVRRRRTPVAAPRCRRRGARDVRRDAPRPRVGPERGRGLDRGGLGGAARPRGGAPLALRAGGARRRRTPPAARVVQQPQRGRL